MLTKTPRHWGVIMKLTVSSVAALMLPEGKTDHIEWDDSLPGFGVRLRGNSKHYIIQYRVGSQQRRESLGDIRKITLEQARSIARQRFAQVELGNDPAAEKARAREAASAAALTLGSVVTRYIDAKRDTVRRATIEAIVRHLDVLFAPLHKRPLGEIKRAEIAAQLQQIIKDSGRTCAARARSNLGALYTWAMREGLCEANPVIGTNDPDPKTSRDRVLGDSELVSVWNGCGDGNFAKIVRLLILTGCRRREIGSLKWSEIDLAAGTMTISAERTKNGRAHTLTLPPMALDIIKSVPRRDGCDYIFGRVVSSVGVGLPISAHCEKSLARWPIGVFTICGELAALAWASLAFRAILPSFASITFAPISRRSMTVTPISTKSPMRWHFGRTTY